MGKLGLIGLIVIIIAWIIQLVKTAAKSRELSLGFVWIYFIGVLLLIISSFIEGEGEGAVISGIFNLAGALLAIIVALIYPKKTEEKKEEPEKEGQ